MKKKELALSILVYNIEKMIDVLQTFFKIICENQTKAFGTNPDLDAY